MYIRILSIRKHKEVSFINAYMNKYDNTQFMIDNTLLINIKCGDLIDIEYKNTYNNKGSIIKKIVEIKDKVSCNNFDSGKGINNIIVDNKEKNYIDARNGGFQIQILKYKKALIKKIKEILDFLDYFDASGLTNVIEHYQNGSGIIEAEILNRKSNAPKYLRITLENQLKQMTAITLQSTYAIDKVFRNMGEDSSHINEFLMLEMVSISNDIEKLTSFIKQIDTLSKELAEEYKIIIRDKEISVIDYEEIMKSKIDYEKLRKEFINTIVLNYPCTSPFIKKEEENDIRREIRWYINGHFIAHYYKDENSIENISEILNVQKLMCPTKDNINPLTYFEWGLPATASLGLSIDRWLQMLLDFENIISIANPIALDYQKKMKVK